MGCHGDPSQELKGEFDLTTLEGFMAGGEEFPESALVPGEVDSSYVMQMITWEDEDFEMPPKKNDRLTEEQVEVVRQWIADGAVWPGEERQAEIRLAESKKKVTKDGIIVKTSGGLSEEWTLRRYKPEDIWAFQPLKDVNVPEEGGASHRCFCAGKVVFCGVQTGEARGSAHVNSARDL